MTSAKITIIGGGSYTWGPKFIRDVGITPGLRGSTIVLHDIDPEALFLVYNFGLQILNKVEKGYLFTLKKTTSLDEALGGAQFVILAITTGGLEAMRRDLEIPSKYGIYQSVGDTVGPGGLARALRNIPIIVSIAKRMESLCPDAWLLNYSNPMTTLCRAVTKSTHIKTIGLCHEYQDVIEFLLKILHAKPDDLTVRAGGINHLVWILDLKIRGQDIFPEIRRLASLLITTGGHVPWIDWTDTSSLADHALVKAQLVQTYGALPAAGDRHIAEFFPDFLTAETDMGLKHGVRLTTIEERYKWREEAKSLIEAALRGTYDMKGFVEGTSGEAANQMIDAFVNQRSYRGMLNLPNQGQISNLPLGAVVETHGVFDSSGAHPLPVGELPPRIADIVNRHIYNQELIVESALTGDHQLAIKALTNDPLVQKIDKVVNMYWELING